MTCDTASWRTNRLAPAPGTSLGPLDAIADPSVREFQFDDGRALSGPVEPGCGLEPIPVHVDGGGEIVIGKSEQ